jgi:hypothetical protein
MKTFEHPVSLSGQELKPQQVTDEVSWLEKEEKSHLIAR